MTVKVYRDARDAISEPEGPAFTMECSIQALAREAGTTSRTLRYYGEVGLLQPSRVGDNRYGY